MINLGSLYVSKQASLIHPQLLPKFPNFVSFIFRQKLKSHLTSHKVALFLSTPFFQWFHDQIYYVLTNLWRYKPVFFFLNVQSRLSIHFLFSYDDGISDFVVGAYFEQVGFSFPYVMYAIKRTLFGFWRNHLRMNVDVNFCFIWNVSDV